MQAYLIIQLGNRWSDILRLQPGQPIQVGRSSECQIVVKDERVSRKHAEISPQNGGWIVSDLGSRNGTQVNERTIQQPHELADGETIQVGGCQLTFSLDLHAGIRAGEAQAKWNSDTRGSHQTRDMDGASDRRPTIVNRRSNSQWSSEELAGSSDNVVGSSDAPGNPASGDVAAPRASRPLGEGELWNFFYRLVFDLVGCQSPEAAARVALERLLDQMQLSTGGVVMVDSTDEPPALSVLATHQTSGGSYHRVGDFLVSTVIGEQQAVLARNVQDDSKLSVARASGRREVISVICAPLRRRQDDGSDEVIGLLHVYSSGDERMLADGDLELAVGVADNLAIALTRQLENAELAQSLESSQRRVDQLRQQLDEHSVMVGDSAALSQVRQAILRAGPTSATVLVRGESGVGKELVARAIHQASQRQDGPLVCLNCAALAPSLLESELFGHEKGAFTGATERKIGKFEAAHQGTLLLDEIGEMSAELQAKFLRVLEGQPFERLGGHRPITTDVRVIAATNRALEEAVEAKEFRADLYYRLRVIEIMVPPLRERLDDIPLLVEHFIEQMRHHAGRRLTGIAPAGLELLTRHSWPGNVRELRNVIERAIVLGGSSTIEPSDLNLSPLAADPKDAPAAASSSEFQPVPLAELEQAHVMAMLHHTEGNKTRAAQLLGIERSTLDRKLKRYQAR